MVEEEKMLEYNLMPGLRKSSKLLHIAAEKQIYKFKNLQNNLKYYYCYQTKCPVAVVVDCNIQKYCRKVKKSIKHNHGPQDEIIKKMKLVNSIKSELANGTSLSKCNVRDVFNEQCKKFKASPNAIEFRKMRRQLQRIKSETSTNVRNKDMSNPKIEDPSADDTEESLLEELPNKNVEKKYKKNAASFSQQSSASITTNNVASSCNNKSTAIHNDNIGNRKHQKQIHEFDIFCSSLAIQLKKMPLRHALECQDQIQTIVTRKRLSLLDSNNEAPYTPALTYSEQSSHDGDDPLDPVEAFSVNYL